MSNYDVNYILRLKDRLSGQLKGIFGQTKRLDGQFKSLAKAGAAFGAGMMTFDIVSKIIKQTINNALEAEEVDKRLYESAIKLAGANERQAQSLIDLGSAIQRKSRFGDEDIKTSETQLIQYGLTIKQVRRLTPVIADFAAATGKDMKGATESVIAGLAGQTRGLKKYGLELNLTGDKAKDTNIIMGELNRKFGGAALKDIESTRGQIEQLRNSFGDLLETIGGAATKSGGAVGFLNEFTVALDETIKHLSGQQSSFQTYYNTVTRVSGAAIENQVQANKALIDSQLQQNGGIEGYIKLLDLGGKKQSDFNKARMGVQMTDFWGNTTDEWDMYVVQLEAARESQTLLIDSLGDYIGTLDEVGRNKAFEKIAKQIQTSTENVREFFKAANPENKLKKDLTTISDFEDEIKNLREAQKESKDKKGFLEKESQIKKLQRQIDAITGGKSGGSSGSNATSSTLTSRSPQTFNINITKLVETINTTKPQFNTSDSATIKGVTEALVLAVNDVQQTIK